MDQMNPKKETKQMGLVGKPIKPIKWAKEAPKQ